MAYSNVVWVEISITLLYISILINLVNYCQTRWSVHDKIHRIHSFFLLLLLQVISKTSSQWRLRAVRMRDLLIYNKKCAIFTMVIRSLKYGVSFSRVCGEQLETAALWMCQQWWIGWCVLAGDSMLWLSVGRMTICMLL